MANKFKSSARIISVDRSVGTILAHDITEIRPGQFKGPAFKKGHVIQGRGCAPFEKGGEGTPVRPAS